MPEWVIQKLEDMHGQGKPLQDLIDCIPDSYFDELNIVAELAKLGYSSTEIVSCLEYDFGLDMDWWH